MADDGPVNPVRRAVVDLVLLGRASSWLRVLVAIAVVVVCGAFAQEALSLQHHFADTAGGGRIAHFVARGPTAATAWIGWAAALFFAVALLRLRRGVPEPPAGRTPLESMTLPQMHAGLLREYTVVRVGLVGLSLVAFLDVSRAVRYALAAGSGDVLARAGLVAVVFEAAGLAVAAAVLGAWAFSFRAQLQRLGALR